ncbi:MAG TPA: hypothetical protein VN759_10740 [Pseudolysinimonas sp.]|nr:hypothetical protein [Pseudolysinimonas sp.]
MPVPVPPSPLRTDGSRFVERLLTVFFGEDDAKFLGGNGFDFVRIPVDDHHLAELLRGLGAEELDALADSFAFENCVVRETLLDQLTRG